MLYVAVEKVIGRNGLADTGGLLQNRAGNAIILAQNNAGNGNLDVVDNFNGGANLAGGLGAQGLREWLDWWLKPPVRFRTQTPPHSPIFPSRLTTVEAAPGRSPLPVA